MIVAARNAGTVEQMNIMQGYYMDKKSNSYRECLNGRNTIKN